MTQHSLAMEIVGNSIFIAVYSESRTSSPIQILRQVCNRSLDQRQVLPQHRLDVEVKIDAVASDRVSSLLCRSDENDDRDPAAAALRSVRRSGNYTTAANHLPLPRL